MKQHFKDLVKGVKKACGVVYDKTSETVDMAKLEVETKKTLSNLDKEYKALGQIVYQVEMGSLTRDDQIVAAACKRIEKCLTRLEELNGEKAKKKESKKQSKQEKTADQAGGETSEEEVHPQRNEEGYFVLKFCPFCKVGNHPDAVKCVNCGREF